MRNLLQDRGQRIDVDMYAAAFECRLRKCKLRLLLVSIAHFRGDARKGSILDFRHMDLSAHCHKLDP